MSELVTPDKAADWYMQQIEYQLGGSHSNAAKAANIAQLAERYNAMVEDYFRRLSKSN